MSTKYYHGVRVQEESSVVASPVTGTAGLQVVFGTAPINLVEEPEEAVNIPIVCQSMEEAKVKLGYSEDFQAYTLCQSMYASFSAFAVAPVVFINVLDPTKHKKENEEKEYTPANGQVTVSASGILKKSVVVKLEEETLVVDTDYLLSFDEAGNLIITLISDKAKAAATLKVASSSIDPTLVKDVDIIGGYDVETGKETGLEVLRQVYPRTGMTASLIIAPGWSHKPEIGAIMMAKCEAINGVFSAECLLDLDTSAANIYTKCQKVKEENGYTDRHAIAMWPMAKIDGRQMYYSAVYGAMTSYTDAENDNVPCISPSNLLLHVTDAVLSDGTSIFMDREQANTLNGQGIVTLINESGWRSWGNNTAAYPEVTEIRDRWICCRRMFTWMGNSLITTYHERVDNPGNFRLIESICDAENIRLNSYTAAGKMAGGRVEYDEAENKVEMLLGGHIIFRIYMAAFTPAEDILFILKFDPALLEASLRGGE